VEKKAGAGNILGVMAGLNRAEALAVLRVVARAVEERDE
jgi:hypothetical protein